MEGSQVCARLGGWLGVWRTGSAACMVNALPLPSRVSRPGQVGVTLHLPKTQPVRLCLANELWLDTTPRLFASFLFFFCSHAARQCGVKKKKKKKKCETLLNWADGSQPSYQQARLHSWCTLRRAPEGSLLSAGKRFSLHTQLLLFQYKKGSDFSLTTYYEYMRADKSYTRLTLESLQRTSTLWTPHSSAYFSNWSV